MAFVSLGCPEEPRRRRGDAGPRPRGRARDHRGRGRRRRPRREHLRLHRLAKQESIDAILEMAELQARRQVHAAGRHRLPRRALSRRAAEGDSGDRRGARHRRSAGDRATRSATAVRDPRSAVRTIRAAPVERALSPILHDKRRIRTIATADRGPASRGAPATPSRPTSTTPTRRACSRRRSTSPTSRSPKAATTPARSASSRRCAASIAAGRPTRSSREARALAERGVRELLLISQDTTFFGIDRGERGALARLLRELNAIDGLTWIRLLYLYPTTITDDVLDAMAECEKVCRYVDLPLQHASADVLQADAAARQPRRPTTSCSRGSATACPASRSGRPSSSASRARPRPTSPSSRASSRDTGFDHVGVFTYSHEEGTRAFALADDVPAAVKRQRRERADGAAEADRGRARSRRGSGREVDGARSTARRPSTSWCCRAGSKVRRPTSTRSST